jgi:hypothetical protein
MKRNHKLVSFSGTVLLFTVLLNALLLEHAFVHHSHVYGFTWFTLPLFVITAIFHRKQGIQIRSNSL